MAIEHLDIFPGINILFNVWEKWVEEIQPWTRAKQTIKESYHMHLQPYPGMLPTGNSADIPSKSLCETLEVEALPFSVPKLGCTTSLLSVAPRCKRCCFWVSRKRQTVDSSLHMKFGTYEKLPCQQKMNMLAVRLLDGWCVACQLRNHDMKQLSLRDWNKRLHFPSCAKLRRWQTTCNFNGLI